MDNIKIDRLIVEKACYDSGIRIREGYSGRGMFGKTCFGLVGNLSELCKFFSCLSVDFWFAEKLANGVCYDSMGHDTIYYFPGFELNED
jgi:hypothetical protein